MSIDSCIFVNFMVITTWINFVTKEMNSLEIFFFKVLQAEGLIPAIRKNINADLATCSKNINVNVL